MSLTFNFADLLPVTVGVKFTSTVQLVLGLSEPPAIGQVLVPSIAKSPGFVPPIAMLVIVTVVEALALVTVTVLSVVV